ncbi:MAG: mechanosensitive ion channel family protein [Acidimicrobiia bacterium]|nr:mechanosensitive ion channel family protein [Acidimicrobiia bacterium]
MAIFGVVFVTGWLARGLFFRALHRWAAKSETKLDDLLIEALRAPLLLWVAILGLHAAVQSSELPEAAADVTSKILLVLWILSLTVAGARLAAALVKHYGTRISKNMPVTSLTQNLASLLVATVGLLILLNTLGISVMPILTALGVGGLAVALALQDTLSNLFAGFYISLAGQVRVGDYVKLDSGEEG